MYCIITLSNYKKTFKYKTKCLIKPSILYRSLKLIKALKSMDIKKVLKLAKKT